MPYSNNITKTVIKSAALALERFDDYAACEKAIGLILTTNGPLIISGIGKSGHIAQKLASTFRSLGRDAHFIHAAEASHGDLGCFVEGAVVLLLSNSGETSELSDIVNFCRAQGNPIISITSNAKSTIARASQVAIVYGELEEADPHGLAPTTSTTLALAIGDAIAIGYADAKGFKPHDFAHFHPRGRLGARLQSVGDVMRKGEDLPLVAHDVDMQSLVFALSQKTLGLIILMDHDKVVGVITDGDLRRNIADLWNKHPLDIASRAPKSIAPHILIGDAIGEMSRLGVTQLLVINGEKLEGVIHMHDCMNA